MRVPPRCSRRGWRASINGNRDSIAGSRTDAPVSNDAAGLGPGSRVIALATGRGMHEERLCVWPISGDRRDRSTRGAVKPHFHDAPCHRTSRSPIRDKIELLAIRQEILARVCQRRRPPPMISRPKSFLHVHHRSESGFDLEEPYVGLQDWFRSWSLTRARGEDPSLSGEHLAASSRVGTFRRTFLKSFFQLASVGWSLIPPSPLFVSLLRRQCLQEVTHVM